MGGTGADLLIGNSIANRMDGGLGDDTIFATAGADTLIGGGGTDGVGFLLFGAAVLATLSSSAAQAVAAGISLTMSGFENLAGSGLGDTLGGDGAANRLDGAGGDDVLIAAGGDDTVLGGAGRDTLYGGAGNDSLDGGADDDSYLIEELGDVVTDSAGIDAAFVVVNGYTATAGIEAWYLAGSANRLLGGGGDDVLVAQPGLASQLLGGGGQDTLWGQGGADTLAGEAGQDILRGGAGNDLLLGGAGNDQLVGGADADRFAFVGPGWGYDQVFDFSRAAGDRLDFTGSGIGFAQLTLYETEGSSVVMLGADRIDAYGVTGLTAADFIFG